MRLDLDLSSELVLHIGLHELLLVEHLERHDELRLLLPGEIDMAKLAPSQRLANLEVVNRPLLRTEFLLSVQRGLGEQLVLFLCEHARHRHVLLVGVALVLLTLIEFVHLSLLLAILVLRALLHVKHPVLGSQYSFFYCHLIP